MVTKCVLKMEEDVRRKGKEKKIEIRIGIGEKSRIRRAIVDKNARIGKNVMVTTWISTYKIQFL